MNSENHYPTPEQRRKQKAAIAERKAENASNSRKELLALHAPAPQGSSDLRDELEQLRRDFALFQERQKTAENPKK